MEPQRQSIERFRWRIIPSVFFVFAGVVMSVGAADLALRAYNDKTNSNLLATWTLKVASSDVALAISCFGIATCIMLRRWRTTAILLVIACVFWRVHDAAWNNQW